MIILRVNKKESQTNLADIINKLDKSIPELEAEVAKRKTTRNRDD